METSVNILEYSIIKIYFYNHIVLIGILDGDLDQHNTFLKVNK